MIQCWECTEEMEEGNFCVRCGEVFCSEHFAAHRLSKDCEQRTEELITEQDIA